MADPLSIAASVAGLLSLADSVFRGVFRYSREVSDAQREIKALRDELQSVASVLHGIKLLTETLEQDAPHASFLRLEHIHSCRAVLKEIQSRIAKSDPSPESNKRFERARQSLKWPFGKSRTSEMVNELSRQKETLQLALQADSMADLTECLSKLQNIEDEVNQIHQKVESLEVLTRIRMDGLRSKILDFFMVDDPSPNLRTSWNIRQPLTGLWLTESPRFREWLTEPQSKLWLSGIPGAGKTILAGAAVREALGRLESEPNIGVAFFFCDYKKKASWEIANILQALIAQLGRQKDSAFQILEKYYNKIEPRVGFRTAPDVEDLRDLLVRLVSEFDQVLVVVDGLDECGDKASEVSSTLSDVVQFASNMSMALFSRHEADISDQLETDFDHISIAAHTEDISLYVGAELEKRIEQKRLRLGDSMLKDEIMSSLIEKAQGMFRWVACQLDALSECPTDADRRAALKEMPKDLPETYERILHRINQRHGRVQRLAQLSLKLIAIEESHWKLTIPQLCQAVSTPDSPGTILDKQAIVKDEEIARICSSFIRKSFDGKFFEFSHFSVREYLQDSCLLQRPDLTLYHISNEKVYHAVAVQSLRFLLLGNFDRKLSQDYEEEGLILQDICDEFPLYSFAAEFWPLMAHRARETGILRSSELLDLEKVLFDPRKSTNYQNWLVAFSVYAPRPGPYVPEAIEQTVEDFLGQNISTLHTVTAFNLVEVGMWLIDHDALVHPTTSGPSVSDFAVASILALYNGEEINGFYEREAHTIYRSPTLRESLLTHGGKISDVAFWDATTPMFNVAWNVVMNSGSLSSLQFILESGWLLRPEDISTIRHQVQELLDLGEIEMLEFVRYLNSSGIHKSELGYQLCALFWNRAIELEFDFVSDESLLPTDITMSHEALCSKTVIAVENDDLESLKACEHDPRFDFEMTTTEGEALSLLHIAVNYSASEVLKYLISVARCNIDNPDCRGATPLHYAVRNNDPSQASPAVVLLLEAGASMIATDDIGWNFFHHYANKTSDSVGLRELRKSMHHAKNEAHNHSPKESLSGGTAQDSISSEISFSDWQSINISCCSEKACVWEIAASRGSADVLRALIDVDFPRHLDHPDRNPFQSINYNISLEAFRLLQSQFPSDLHVEKDGDLPVVTFLSKRIQEIASYKVNYINANVIRALLEASPTISSTLRQALDFCCNLVRSPVSVEKKKELLAPFLDYGFDVHPTAPLPSTLSQVWLLFPTEGKYYGSSSDSVSKSILNSDHESDGQSDHEVDYELRSLMSFMLDHVDSNKLNQLDSAGLSIIHKTYGPLNADRKWFLLELIKRGADVNVCGAGQNSHTPLVTHLYASSIDSALIILNSGADPTLAYPGGFDAVQAAIYKGAIKFLRRLMELADTASFNIEWTRLGSMTYRNPINHVVGGLNVLHLAVLSGSVECFDLLIKKQLYTSIHSTSHQSYNCMHFAAWRGSTQMIEHLHKLGVSIIHASADGTTPLHMAIRANQIEAVQKLIHLKAPMVADFRGVTPFMLAKKMKLTHILETLSKSRELLQMKSEGGIFIEKARVKHWSSVMEGAVRANDYLYCDSLLRDGCPVDVPLRNCGGCSPLLLSLTFNSPFYENLTRLFLSHSASVSRTSCVRHGLEPALERALCLPHSCPLLSDMLDSALNDNWTCISGALIVRMIRSGNTKALVILLAHLKDNRAEYAHLLGCTPELVVTYIINGGGGHNPMHQAVWQGNLEIVECLVEYGADIHTADMIGRTPLHMCKQKNIAGYLLSIGATPALPPWSIWYRLSSGSVKDLTTLGEQVTQMSSSLGDRTFLPDLIDRSLLSIFVSNRNNLDMVDDVGRSIVHLAMCTHATGSVVLNGNIRLTGSKPFPWHRMCYPTMVAYWLGRLWRLYRRRFDAEDLRQVSNLHPKHGWSPMCLATCSDDTLVMANCLEMGADINFEGSPYGSPLMAAAFSNRLKSVKFLVRNGAAICYEGKGGFKSAVIIGKRCQRVVEWLIMDRFRDQEKLEGIPEPSFGVGSSPQVATGVWSSIVVPLRLMGRFERQPHESSYSYLRRLAAIKSAMRGKVVPLPRPEILSKSIFTATYSL